MEQIVTIAANPAADSEENLVVPTELLRELSSLEMALVGGGTAAVVYL